MNTERTAKAAVKAIVAGVPPKAKRGLKGEKSWRIAVWVRRTRTTRKRRRA